MTISILPLIKLCEITKKPVDLLHGLTVLLKTVNTGLAAFPAGIVVPTA